jgi:hypothetical protein
MIWTLGDGSCIGGSASPGRIGLAFAPRGAGVARIIGVWLACLPLLSRLFRLPGLAGGFPGGLPARQCGDGDGDGGSAGDEPGGAQAADLGRAGGRSGVCGGDGDDGGDADGLADLAGGVRDS